MQMNAIILCNGSITDYDFYKPYLSAADFILCADGGASHARRFDIIPDMLMGDFDSVAQEDFEFFKSKGVPIEKFPIEKDMTDTELAVETVIQKGYQFITVIGGLGSRADHSLANIFLLRKIHFMGARGMLVDEHNEIFLISDKITLKKRESYKLTLLPLSEKAEGVTTQGLYYPLCDAVIEMGSTWGVSNEFISDTAKVSVGKGLLLIILSRD